jgi:tetratricopeptide (TPR) repeat protein
MKRNSSLACALFVGMALGAAPVVVPAMSGGGGGGQPSINAPRYDPAKEYQKGIEALQAENFKDADRAFGRVLQAAPRDANVNFLAGLARAGLDKPKDARRYYEKAIKYDDNLILAHRELGLTWIRLGKPDKAQEILEDLQKRSSKCGGHCPQAADLKAAIPAVEAALGSMPTSQVAAPSESLFTSAERGDQAYLTAVALINEKRYDEALAALDVAARAFGPHPDVLTYIGFVNRKQGRFDVAESYYRRALAAAPEHLGATEYWGELMVERGDLDGARAKLARLDRLCRFGCAEADELRRWITAASSGASA